MSGFIETLRLSLLLPLIEQEFRKVLDIRKPEESAFSHSMSDTLMVVLAMMVIQDPSMLSHQVLLHDGQRRYNLCIISGIEKGPYGYGENHLTFVYVIRNFLAYMLHQVIARSDRLLKAAMEKIGSEFKLGSDIRVLVSSFVWKYWEAMLEHVLD